MTVITEKRVY